VHTGFFLVANQPSANIDFEFNYLLNTPVVFASITYKASRGSACGSYIGQNWTNKYNYFDTLGVSTAAAVGKFALLLPAPIP
jgi:hypothetical protein